MQAVKKEHRADDRDVLNAPGHMVAEVIDGTLHTQPRPAMPHARASSSLGAKIGGPFDYDSGGPGGWWIIDEPELHLADDILVPNLAGWRRERMSDFPDSAYVTFAPDWDLAKCSPPEPAGWISMRNGRSTPAKAFPGSGSWTRPTGLWRCSSSTTVNGF